MAESLDKYFDAIGKEVCPGCFNRRRKDDAIACPICTYRFDADRSGALLAVGTRLERYLVGEKLGQGGFGITYRGLDLRLHMKVAIKEYYPSDLVGRSMDRNTVILNSREHEATFSYGLRTFLKEARTLAQLKHPNLVRVLNYFETNGTAYLVMDYLEGENLMAHLKRWPLGRLPWIFAVRLLLPVLDGLCRVHEAGFMHRDIKPDNLYQTDEGLILLDFGSARQIVGSHTRSFLVFTKGYAPYEQYLAAHLNRQGPWTDVYGIAATLYFMLTSQRPPSALDRKQNDLLRQPDLLKPASHFVPEVPTALDTTLRLALAVEPEQRLQSVKEFKERLETVLAAGERAEQAPQAPLDIELGTDRPVPPNRNRRAATLTTVLIGLLSAAVWFGLRTPPEQTGAPIAPTALPPPAMTAPVAETRPRMEAAPTVNVEPENEPSPVARTLPTVGPVPGAVTRPSHEPEMVLIPAGCFQMGSPTTEGGRAEDERQHQVCVEAFEIGPHEVTTRDFRQFTDATGYLTDAERNTVERGCYAWTATAGRWGWIKGIDWRHPGYPSDDAHPVVCVSWNDATAYTAWLSQQTARRYRLPTEAEWEYMARAGTTSARYWGQDADQACNYANVADLTPGPGGHAWAAKHNCMDKHWYTAPVGSFQANAWNISDLLGNVWEWTCSAYDKSYGGAETTCVGVRPEDPVSVRGGSWYYRPAWVRTAKRDRVAAFRRHLDGGFRLARSL